MTEPAGFEGGHYNERRYYGCYRGIVVDVADPKRLGRIKCRVPEVLGLEIVTDWAWPAHSCYGGMEDYGDFSVPEVGSSVFVEFESGDVNRPIYRAVWWGHPAGKPPEPPKLTREDGQTCWKQDESTLPPKGSDGFKSASCTDECQPVSPLRTKGPPKYPFNHVIKTKNNRVVVEIDDTPGRGRVHVWHGPSKSWIEIDKDGELSIRVADKSYVLVEKDDRRHVKGSQHTFVEQDMTNKVGKDRWLVIHGAEKRVVSGDRDTFVTGAERRVNSGGLQDWTQGDRTDIIVGDYHQIVVGNFTASVFGSYRREASGTILDFADAIYHRKGGPSGSPPSPPEPPTCGEPSCPPVPMDQNCPPMET